MSLSKFLSLLSRSQIFFCNLEILSRSDPHEGMLSMPNFRHREWNSLSDLTEEEAIKIGVVGRPEFDAVNVMRSLQNSAEYWVRRRSFDRRTMSINCWHVNPYESAAMWAIYGLSDEGVAITSNYERLESAFASSSERIFAGFVEYLDFDIDKIDNSLAFPLQKRKSFAYENEFRLIHWNLKVQDEINKVCQELANDVFYVGSPYRHHTDPIWSSIDERIRNIGVAPSPYIEVNLEKLIDRIYVSPTCSQFFLEVIQSVAEKYGISAPIVRSDIRSSPLK